nr:HPr family phosphocarrier protein [uncultured Blautia sp.]
MEEIRIFLGTIERVKNFVNEVSYLECDVDIVSGRYVIDAKSIMGIFSTDLSKPVNVRIHAQGAEAEKALQVVRKYAEE